MGPKRHTETRARHEQTATQRVIGTLTTLNLTSIVGNGLLRLNVHLAEIKVGILTEPSL